ncbi:hypothetical protein ACP70R_027351 [Stipagrostis hirtigluma subsp. patula]
MLGWMCPYVRLSRPTHTSVAGRPFQLMLRTYSFAGGVSIIFFQDFGNEEPMFNGVK